MVGLRNRTDLEFAPQGVNILLLVIHTRILHEVIPHGRVGPVSTDHEVKLDFDLLGAARGAVGIANLEPGFTLLEICAGKLVTEEELDVRHSLENV